MQVANESGKGPLLCPSLLSYFPECGHDGWSRDSHSVSMRLT